LAFGAGIRISLVFRHGAAGHRPGARIQEPASGCLDQRTSGDPVGAMAPHGTARHRGRPRRCGGQSCRGEGARTALPGWSPGPSRWPVRGLGAAL